MENNVIILNAEDRTKLEQFAKSGVHSAREICKAKAILAMDRANRKDHLRMGRISEALSISRRTLYNYRDKFLNAGSVEEFLPRKKRETPPVPPKVTGEVEAHIVALACSNVPEGYARWTLRLLASKSVELGYIDSISHKSVGEVLKKRNTSLI